MSCPVCGASLANGSCPNKCETPKCTYTKCTCTGFKPPKWGGNECASCFHFRDKHVGVSAEAKAQAETKEVAAVEFRVSVTVVQGRNLLGKDLRGHSDPFVKLTMGGQTQQTPVLKTTLAPIWKQRLDFPVTTTRPLDLQLECLDWNRISANRSMGEAKIDLTPYWRDPDNLNGEYKWIPLTVKDLKAGATAGEIQVQITCTDKPVPKAAVYSHFTHLIELTIVGGKEIVGDVVGKADAFCQVEWGGQLFRTTAVQNSSNPVWNQTMFIWMNQTSESAYKLCFTVKDQDYLRNQTTGYAYLPIQQVFERPEVVDRELMLEPTRARTDAELRVERAASGKALGKIIVRCKLHEKEALEKEFFDSLLAEFGQLSTEGEDAQTLDSAEASFMFETVGIKMTEEMFNKLDRDKNGRIDRAELSAYLTSEEAQKSADLNKLLIHMRNKGDGTLSATLMEGFTRKAAVGQIAVKDLETGNVVFENIPGYIKAALHVMSDTKLTRMVTSHAKALMANLSKKQGVKYDQPSSAREIQGFVKLHGLDIKEVELDISEYKTFNEFFARKLKAGARPVDTPSDPTRACSPADARMMVFEDYTLDCSRWIKGAKFTVENLLAAAGKDYVTKLNGGSMVIARLAPQDYHRWHIPVKGVLGPQMPIPGALYTVNPIAINHAVNVYTENKRCLIPIHSEEFGLVMLVAVGAIMVGSMVIDGKEGDRVNKGDLHGYFKFGGSTVLVLFQKGRIQFRPELLANSKENMESLIKCGAWLGTATQPGKKD